MEAEEGEAKAGAAGTRAAFSPGEDDSGMGYLEELLGAGPQVRRSLLGWGSEESQGKTRPGYLATAVPTGGGVLCGAPPG